MQATAHEQRQTVGVQPAEASRRRTHLLGDHFRSLSEELVTRARWTSDAVVVRRGVDRAQAG